MTRITITLSEEEKNALCALAKKEFRDTRAQAALIIRKELERLELIKPANPTFEKNQTSRPAGEITSPAGV